MEGYIYGSAARKREEEIHPIWENRRKERRSLRLNAFTWLLALSMAGVLMGGFVYSIDLMADTAVLREEYFALQTEYKNLKDRNDNAEEAIENSVNMEEIRRLAIEEFGMKLPGEGQVAGYTSDVNDYVEQYADIR